MCLSLTISRHVDWTWSVIDTEDSITVSRTISSCIESEAVHCIWIFDDQLAEFTDCGSTQQIFDSKEICNCVVGADLSA